MAEEVEMTPISSDELPPKAAPFGAPVAPAASAAPAAAAAPAATAAKPATIRLKPMIRKPVIRKPGEAPVVSAPVAPAPSEPKKGTQSLKSLTGGIPAQATLKKTGIIAEGILTPAQQQAAKSKTSRISLEAAMGVAPVAPAKGPAAVKTIRLRRPVDLNKPPAPSPFAASVLGDSSAPTVVTSTTAATVVKPAPVPDAPVVEPVESADAVGEPDAAVTQKKTLKLHRPGTAIKRPSVALPGTGETTVVLEAADIPDMPTMDTAFMPAPVVQVKDMPGWFTAITLVTSLAALLVLGATFYFLWSEGVGPVAGENVTAFIEM